MDILTHTLSGVAIGTVISNCSNDGFKHKLKIVLISGFAGALPDLDAISLWSGFDATIGNFFHLSHTGKEIYFAKFWYSHHTYLHSLLAGFFITGLIGIMGYLTDNQSNDRKTINFITSIYKNKFLLIGFFLGFLIHLVEDMPTPASTWGGINFFCPSKLYIGGIGAIWWWNNYDIFLIVVTVIIINLILSIIRPLVSFHLGKFAIGTFITGVIIIVFQISTRDYDFGYMGHTTKYQEFEIESKQQQKDILGDSLYQIMEDFDNKLSIYF